MGSLLGFRSPQFSEDGEWLPCWLQQEDCDAKASALGLEEGQASPERCVEGHHNSQKHICNISADQFLGEEGRYTNCHLYLSGDDSSVLTVTPSIDNVTQFQLHLSLDCSSVGTPSPCIDAFHVERNEIYSDLHPEVSEPKVNSILNSEQSIDAIVCSLVPEFQRTENDMTIKELEEKSRSLEVKKICDAVVASQSIVDHNVMNCSLALECDRAPEDQSLGGLDKDTRLVDIEQTDDAVEMSISASEALVIHEVLRTLSSEFPVSSVLEAALQLKRARLEVWKDSHETSCNPLLEEEITDTEYHLDSEDIHKEDVYDHLEGDNLSVSQVKDTLDSEICGQDRKSKLVSTSTSQYDHYQGYNLSVSQVKDTLDSESCGQDRKAKAVTVQLPNTERNLHGDDFTNHKVEEVHENDHQLTQNTVGSYDCDWHNKSTMGLPSTSMSHQSNPMLHLLGQTEDHNSMEDCSLQANFESPRAKRFEIEGQHYGVSGTVCNRFQSRWFGGWSGNDTNISVPMRPNNIKIVAGHFAGETSYLSESADIAPDENSFVGPKPDEKSFIAFKSAIPSEGTLFNMNNQVLSQDASRFSSPSYVDPLCSVVPCSIPSQNMLSRSALCDNKQGNMELFFTPGNEHVENLQSNSNLDNKALSEQISISEASADRPEHSVHNKLISMRSISMRPCYVSSLKNGNLGKTCLLEKSLPPPNLYGSTESEHGFPSGLQKEMNSHFLSMTKGSVQHLDNFSSEFGAEANGKQIEGNHTVAEIPTHPNLLKLQLIHENQNITSSGTIKRVRFAEHETKVPHGEKRLKQQITSNACHTVRASKCLRLSRSHFESRAQNKKGTLTNCQAKFVKTLLFQSMKFLLTGFPKKRLKRIEDLIRKYGGTVLTDIPFESKRKRSSRQREQTLPVVLCPKKLQTMKFLYGCAVGALTVKAKWLTDSIAASSLLPPEQYMILRKSFGGSLQTEILLRGSSNYIFDGIGIMLHGSKRNCTGIAKVIEHGGGRVFKTLQKLVSSLDAAKITLGFIVTEDGSWTSRHLKQCALEKKIPIMSVQWIVNSLHAQKLLPFTEKKDVVSLPLIKLPDSCSIGWSQEI